MADENPEAPDEALVSLSLEGDRDALAALVRRHQRWIYNLAFRMLSNHADAEDAAQEILLKIATRLGSFENRSAFRTWAYRIATNHLLDRTATKAELTVSGFACFSGFLERSKDDQAPPAEHHYLVEEAKQTCLS